MEIRRIALDAYHEGCYVTEQRVRAEEQAKFVHMMAENKKLREILTQYYETHMLPIVMTRDKNAT